MCLPSANVLYTYYIGAGRVWGHAEILRESERGNRQTTTTFVEWAGVGRDDPAAPAPTHYVPSGVSMPAAHKRTRTRRYTVHSRTASPGIGFGRCAQCHRRPDSGESCVASVSVRPGLWVVVRTLARAAHASAGCLCRHCRRRGR